MVARASAAVLVGPLGAVGTSSRGDGSIERGPVDRGLESASMTALSESLANGNCPTLEENAACASLVGSLIAARLGAAAYPTTPIAVIVAPPAIVAAARRILTVRRRLGRPVVRARDDGGRRN